MNKSESELIAYTQILSGLLASGHFTRASEGYSRGPEVIRDHYDEPRVLLIADELFESAKISIIDNYEP